MNATTVSLLVIAAALISALDKALTEDVRIFPSVSMAWRTLIACAGGVIVGALEQTVGGAAFLVSLAAGLGVAAPTLVRLLLVAVLGAPQVVKTIACVAFLAALSSTQTGCAGSLDTARGDGFKLRLAAAPAPSVECARLDSAHRTWSAVAEGVAFAAGASGIAIIPIDDKTGRVLLVSAGVVLGTAAAVSTWVSGDYAAAWARECAQ